MEISLHFRCAMAFPNRGASFNLNLTPFSALLSSSWGKSSRGVSCVNASSDFSRKRQQKKGSISKSKGSGKGFVPKSVGSSSKKNARVKKGEQTLDVSVEDDKDGGVEFSVEEKVVIVDKASEIDREFGDLSLIDETLGVVESSRGEEIAQLHQPIEEKQQIQQPLTIDMDTKIEKKETSTESSSNIEMKEKGETTLTPLFDTMELIDGFCIDEVPMIEPNEIIVSNSSTSNSTSSSSTSNSTNFLENLQFPDFEWSNNDNKEENNSNDLAFWDDDFIRSLNLLINDDTYDDGGCVNNGGERKQAFEEMIVDSESWAHGLF